jgi:hypothetical protein
MQIVIEQLNERMRDIVADRERSYRRQFAAAVKQVMKSLDSVEKAARNLAEATRRAWGTLTRPAEQHGVRLSAQVLEACASLTAHSPTISYEELRKFEERCLHAVRSIVKAYNKYVGSVIRSVKSEASILESSIADLGKSITELSRVLDASDLRELQLVARDANQLAQNASELRLKIDHSRESNEALREAQQREAKLQNDLSLLGQDQNFKELTRIEQLTKQRETETLALFEPLSKAFRKADRPDSTSSVAWNQAIVSRLAENPLAAMLETPVGEMRELFRIFRGLIERNELFLDQRRKRKSTEAIETLEGGALERFREDHGILQANRQEVLRQLKGSGIYDRWMSMRNELDSARAEVARLHSHIRDLQSQQTRLRTLIQTDKAKMESALKEILNEPVSIIVTF